MFFYPVYPVNPVKLRFFLPVSPKTPATLGMKRIFLMLFWDASVKWPLRNRQDDRMNRMFFHPAHPVILSKPLFFIQSAQKFPPHLAFARVRFPFKSIQSMPWDRISLIGVGLLGGSLGLAIKQRKMAGRVHAHVRRPESIAECQQFGTADFATQNIAQAVEGADFIIICTPLAQMREVMEQMGPHLKPGAIITDVGSVKGSVVQELEPLALKWKCEFVGSHPMAGSEKRGMSASRADLFQGAICLITPTNNSSPKAFAAVQQLWKDLGSTPVRMTPDIHDDLVSRSSHLPHVVAAELANYVLSPAHPKEQAMVCATGFRDTTRIAASSPEVWRDIALANHKNLARVLGVFIEDLQEFQLALERGDAKIIEEFFANASKRRAQWSERTTGVSPE